MAVAPLAADAGRDGGGGGDGAAADRAAAPSPLAIALLACAGSAKGMWQPLRIDHHGWQLAMLAWAAAALTDPKRARGGVTLGLATALSLAIGLEMLLYLAVAGAIVVLMWVRDGGEARRLAAYGVSLGRRLRASASWSSPPRRTARRSATRCRRSGCRRWSRAGAVAVVLAWLTPGQPLGAARRSPRCGGAALAGAFAWPGRIASAGSRELARARAAVALQGARGDADLAARRAAPRR